MIEIYNTINDLNPEYKWELFTTQDVPYNTCSNELCKISSAHSQLYGISYLSIRGILLWNVLSDRIKLAPSIINLIKEIRHWNSHLHKVAFIFSK